MSYQSRDTSAYSGAPIECYMFEADHKTWFYTSYHTEVTVQGDLYTPLPVTRTAVEIGSVIDSPTTMDFNIPSDHEIARLYCYTESLKRLDITVKRVHEGSDFSTESVVEWRGEISGASASGDWATIKTNSKLQTRLNTNLGTVYYQKTCNHILFDARCQVVRADFTVTATVTRVQGQVITVDDMVYPDDELILGIMTNTRTGEQQGIVANDADVVRVGYRFFDIVVGDVVELTLGCNHQRLGDCKNRFNNTAHYGGFDHIPEVNPFKDLAYQSQTNITERVRSEQQYKLMVPVINGGVA